MRGRDITGIQHERERETGSPKRVVGETSTLLSPKRPPRYCCCSSLRFGFRPRVSFFTGARCNREGAEGSATIPLMAATSSVSVEGSATTKCLYICLRRCLSRATECSTRGRTQCSRISPIRRPAMSSGLTLSVDPAFSPWLSPSLSLP
ncbi:hypothetical protein TIFTF001_025242 [Ficus carica]|uniref:Uncharacterized protein n=1 Tax=Ficus carica TaxID=3494 RepID=A0AA88DGI4_FICCA|nr:hypothetical protein TIFTF001_025242 [Ficus carica]